MIPGRRRAWLRAACVLVAVAVYLNVWTTYALYGLTEYGRYTQQQPGASTTAMGAEFRLVSLVQTTELVNSVTEAVGQGVPLVVLPFSTDQFAGAAAIERVGIGRARYAREASARASCSQTGSSTAAVTVDSFIGYRSSIRSSCSAYSNSPSPAYWERGGRVRSP